MMKRIICIWVAAIALLFSACSDGDYVNVIPKGSTALVAIDGQQTGPTGSQLLQSLFPETDITDCGIDLASKIYLFESPEGDIGLVAKVVNEQKVEKLMSQLAEKGVCQTVTERKDVKFSILSNNWVIGFHAHALMAVGPVVAAQHHTVMQQMARYMRQDEQHGAATSRLFQKLDSISSPMAMVAQVAALPEQLTAPFMIGAPKEADASQVILSARMDVEEGVLFVKGSTSSFQRRIDESLQSALSLFRQMDGRFLNNVSPQSVLSLLTHVEGGRFLPLLQQNKGFQALLTGANTAIDMNKVLQAVDGDLLLSFPAVNGGNMRMVMGAQVGNTDFWKEADYWRKTAPRDFWFDLRRGNGGEKAEFLCGNTGQVRLDPQSDAQLSPVLVRRLQGQRLCMILQLSALDETLAQTVSRFLKPLFGDVSAIVYTLEDPFTTHEQL